MQGMLAQKLVMTQAIDPSGKATAVTILKADPNIIKQIKTADKDGYFALQLGFPVKNSEGKVKKFRRINEFRFEGGEYKIGDAISVDIFEVGDKVQVTGTTKGRGFAGTVKRHGFHRGPMSHGHDHHRAPGSIGPMGMPRVQKGRRMAGHMGNVTVTMKTLKVMAVDPASNLIAISGAIPGANKGIVKLVKRG